MAIAIPTSTTEIMCIAFRDYDHTVITIDQMAIERLNYEYINTGLADFTHIGPDWSLQNLAVFWVFAGAQAFRFWTRNDNGSVSRYHYRGYSGTNAMLHRVADYWEESRPRLASTDYLFDGMPSTNRRVVIADSLLTDWLDIQHFVQNVIREISASRTVGIKQAAELAHLLPEAFADPYLKKAQFTLAAIASCIQKRSNDITIHCKLTAFADYQVPRVLRALGILNYGKELAHLVDSGMLIQRDGHNERCIWAATIIAVDNMAAYSGLSTTAIDNALWHSQSLAKSTPFHLTNTDAY